MNELQIFNFDDSPVRTLTIENFLGKDVAEVLGYSNTRDALAKHVDPEDRNTVAIRDGKGNPNQIVINESGLYSLILGSKLPNAKRFKRWVTSEVLPAIRKTGMYAVDQLLDNPDLAIKAFTALKAEREKNKILELQSKIKDQRIAELKPKAGYYDVVLSSSNAVSISKIAKDYGKSAQWLNDYLSKKKVQYKQGGVWLLYQKYADKGYTKSDTHPYTRNDGSFGSTLLPKWTQKGRLFIYELLKADGILPIIERSADDD